MFDDDPILTPGLEIIIRTIINIETTDAHSVDSRITEHINSVIEKDSLIDFNRRKLSIEYSGESINRTVEG